MRPLLELVSHWSMTVILVACGIHLVAFLVLWVRARRDLRRIASSLDEFTRGLKHRSLLDPYAHLSDQIDGFLADVNEVLEHPDRKADRALLLQRLNILDERRNYLHSLRFETAYNICRTMIEAYPMAGVLATVLAIGSSLQVPVDGATGSTVGRVVQFFGDAIWSTFAGLMSAIVLMFINGLLEPSFMRLAENRQHVRDVIARAKRELSLSAGDGT